MVIFNRNINGLHHWCPQNRLYCKVVFRCEHKTLKQCYIPPKEYFTAQLCPNLAPELDSGLRLLMVFKSSY